MIELFIFLMITGAIVAWWQLMQGRQKDDTVSLSSITWNRQAASAVILVNYGFEFATNGAVRRSGVASLGFPGSLTVTLDLEEGRLIEELRGR